MVTTKIISSNLISIFTLVCILLGIFGQLLRSMIGFYKLIMNPDTQKPGIISSPTYIAAGSPTILPIDQSFIMLYFEPDLTMTRIVNAWLCANMQPKSAGEIVGRRETANSAEAAVTVDIEFTSWTMIGAEVVTLAQNYLNSMKLTDFRPLELKPFTSVIDPNVTAQALGLAAELTAAVTAPAA